MTQIPWSHVRVQDVTDGVGRTFKWSALKGKAIFLCGHGAHLFKDGYCQIAAGTTVNFYQTYGSLMPNFTVWGFIAGGQLPLERSIGAGQGCPDMTLFDDDDNQFARTNAALAERVRLTEIATSSTPTSSPVFRSTRKPAIIPSMASRPCA